MTAIEGSFQAVHHGSCQKRSKVSRKTKLAAGSASHTTWQGRCNHFKKTSRGRNFLSDFSKAIALNLRQAFGTPGVASECSARREDSALRIRSAHIQTLRKRNSGDRQRGEFPTSGAEGRGDSLGRRKLPSAASLGSQFTFARFSQGLPIFRSECLPDVTPAQA